MRIHDASLSDMQPLRQSSNSCINSSWWCLGMHRMTFLLFVYYIYICIYIYIYILLTCSSIVSNSNRGMYHSHSEYCDLTRWHLQYIHTNRKSGWRLDHVMQKTNWNIYRCNFLMHKHVNVHISINVHLKQHTPSICFTVDRVFCITCPFLSSHVTSSTTCSLWTVPSFFPL